MKYVSCPCDLGQNSLRLFEHCMKRVLGTLDGTQMKWKPPLLPSDLYFIILGEPKMPTVGLLSHRGKMFKFLAKALYLLPERTYLSHIYF